MRKVRVFEHISLDGMIEAGTRDEDSSFANGRWTAPYRSPAGAEVLTKIQGHGFDLLLGRRTYDLWAAYWRAVKSAITSARLWASSKFQFR